MKYYAARTTNRLWNAQATDESDHHNVEQKKPETEEYTLNASIYVKLRSGQNEFMLWEVRRVNIPGE